MKKEFLLRSSTTKWAILLLLFLTNTVWSQICNWQDATIGSNVTGSAIYDSCAPVMASISTIAYSSSSTVDGQNFVYRELCGDGKLIVRLTDLNPISGYYGIEFRADLTAGAMKFGLKKSGTASSLTQMSRNASYASVNNLFVNDFNRTWFKIERSGDVFTSYTSSDGSDWLQKQTMTIVMPRCIVSGMLVHGFDVVTEMSGGFGEIYFSEEGENSSNSSSIMEYNICGFMDAFEYQEAANLSQLESEACTCEGLGINTGYFSLHFSDCANSDEIGFDDVDINLAKARMKVVCQVFHEISQIITPRDGDICGNNLPPEVNINIRPSILGPAGFLARAGPIRMYTPAPYIAYEEPWLEINAGTQRHKIDRLFYEGELEVNFGEIIVDENTNQAINWHLDLDSPPADPLNPKVDFYTVIYHEVFHILGFNAFGFYDENNVLIENATRFSYYAHFLQLNNDPANTLPDNTNFIVFDENENHWKINTNINFPDDLEDNCESASTGWDMVFNGTTNGKPVYVDGGAGTILSHLHINCDDTPTPLYLMSGSPLSENERRYPTADDWDVLCTLGYDIDVKIEQYPAPYSYAYNCSGDPVVAIDDFGPDCDSNYEIISCNFDENEYIDLKVEDLIANDINVTGILDISTVEPYMGYVNKIDENTYRFRPIVAGLAKLYYISKGADGKEGSTGFIFIQCKYDATCGCVEGTSCEQLAQLYTNHSVTDYFGFNCTSHEVCGASYYCGNLICNSSFCGNLVGSDDDVGWLSIIPHSSQNGHTRANVSGWVRTNGNPFVGYSNDEPGKITIASSLYSSDEDVENITRNGGIMSYLTLVPGTKYLFGMYTDNNDKAFSKVSLIAGKDLDIPYAYYGDASYSNSAEMDILEFAPLASGHFAKYFDYTDISLDAIWIRGITPLEKSVGYSIVSLPELIIDDFSAGSDKVFECGDFVEIGQKNCMLSNVEINYKWFNETTNDLIAEFNVANGEVTEVILGNVSVFNCTALVSPTETTIYKVVRSINSDLDVSQFQLDVTVDFVTVAVNPICGDIQLNETDILSEISNATLPLNGTDETVCISGTLLINTDYWFGGELIMDANAKIIVEDGFTLTLDDANVHGCNFLWEGIKTLTHNARVVCIASRIEDAKIGIESKWCPNLIVQNSIFNKNYIGLELKSGDFGDFYGNTFDCTENLLPDINDGIIGKKTYIGIRAIGHTKRIGVNNQTPNVFQNIRNGIFYRRFNLIVRNTQFINILSDEDEDYNLMGNAIFHYDAKLLNQVGFGKNPAINMPSFVNCETAIWSNKGGDVKITGNLMQNVGTGIKVKYSTRSRISINKNYIETSSKGIELFHNDPTDEISIRYNDIKVGESAVGIEFQETSNPHNQAIVEENVIDLNNVLSKGIFTQNPNNIHFKHNVFNVNDSYADYAMKITGGEDCLFSCNKVYGTSIASTVGLDIWSTISTQYKCNYIKHVHTGMKFSGICDIMEDISGSGNTHVMGTTFKPPFEIGLHYTESLVMNGQNHKGNKWLGVASGYSDVAARHDGLSFEIIQSSRYKVHSDFPPFFPPSINEYAQDAQWFLPSPGVPEACGENNLCPDTYIVNPKVGFLAKKVAMNESINNTYASTSLWEAKRILYKSIKNNLSLLGEDTDVDLFYNSAQFSEIEKFNAIQVGSFNTWNSSITELELIKFTSNELALNIENLIAKDDLIAQSPTPNLLLERESLLQTINTQNTNIEALSALVNSNKNNEIAVLKNDNNSISTDAIYKENKKMVNDIYLSTLVLGNTDFTSTQKATLLFIAQQCPLEGGNVVFKARALYALVKNMEYDDSSLCGNTTQLLVSAENISESIEDNIDKKVEPKIYAKFRIYPNPVNDLLTLTYKLDKKARLTVFDIYGRKIIEKLLFPDATNLRLNIQDITNGVYFLKVYDANNEYFTTKVVIQH